MPTCKSQRGEALYSGASPVFQSEIDPVLFPADQGEMVHTGGGWIRNESESVAIRERSDHGSRGSSGDRDPGCVLNEGSTHLVGRLVGGLCGDDPAPFNGERVDDPQDLVDRPIHSQNAVGHGKRIVHADVSGVKRRGSGIQIRVGAPLRNVYGPEYVRC